MTSVISRLRSLMRGVRGTDQVDAEMAEEFRAHIEMRAADLQRAGLPSDEAMRRARVEFGGTYDHGQQAREARGLRRFDALRFSWLDFRLGLRMLRKHPGLAVVSTLAMGVAIAVGAGGSTVLSLVTSPALPLHEGDRVVGIQLWDVERWRPERRILHDAADWRSLRTLQDLGTFRPFVRNLVDDAGRAESVRGVEMSAAGFRVARVQPLLGRYLVDQDELPGAARVVVIGHDLWRHQFGRDSAIVGRSMAFGGQQHTIVGVMPPGFRFPVSYEAWVAPGVTTRDYQRREGPALFAFARLAPGVTIRDAQAELLALNARAPRVSPDSQRRLEPRVLPFPQSWSEMESLEARLVVAATRFAMALLLLVICVNVAVLVFARTATRQGEVAVRSALGASRGRIIAQFFGEALVLAVLAAGIGLGIVWFVATRADQIMQQLRVTAMPFWMRFEVSGTTVAYLVALATVSAVIIGVIPALRVTGRRVQLSLQRLGGGGATLRMGRAWTALIVVEVALTVAMLPGAVHVTSQWAGATLTGPGYAAEQYLTASFAMERRQTADYLVRSGDPTPDELRAFHAHYRQARARLADRLAREPGLMAFTFTGEIPGIENSRRLEVESLTVVDTSRDGRTRDARVLQYPVARDAVVDVGFLRMFEVPLIAGRHFALSDTGASVAIVNRSFVDSLLDGRSSMGRRIRDVFNTRDGLRAGPWREIIGVVEDFPVNPVFDRTRAATYVPARVGDLYPAMGIFRTRGDPAAFGPRLRAIALEAEPAFLVREVSTLDAQIRSIHDPLKLVVIGLGAVTLSVLLLSAAGIYALMSVVVTQRRREIGIRIALGATRQRVLGSVFRRAALQLGAGVALGISVAAVMNLVSQGEMAGRGRHGLLILAGVALFMAAVGALAALQPARRGLRIQPTEALKSE